MFMKRNQRKWTKEEKLQIIQDVQRLGVITGCRKHEISPTNYYSWLEVYNAYGIEGLDSKRNRDTEREVKALKKENLKLKELLAEKELQSKFKDELLKKKFAAEKKKGRS